ncbi:hypothetical protein PHYSODRAFT_322181 [Phytophthora sojae]|uniref:Uncharacterized protein n=1 Tax=Phytophthora sojae (strain P6497) TaxID=1094619 RepID=G4YIU3_PHYSP|nr:hypothetical protein PHYSODRAFT_322181 [Phytophthora sojae]EGZ28513.1 hypothetical protein PHYSODRAFT_322181 [Phytophthora sojae]|eukprot:XP_009515788.1 hypothetical protein PHYSODRAFT_322181 [Phytophthora sojae]
MVVGGLKILLESVPVSGDAIEEPVQLVDPLTPYVELQPERVDDRVPTSHGAQILPKLLLVTLLAGLVEFSGGCSVGGLGRVDYVVVIGSVACEIRVLATHFTQVLSNLEHGSGQLAINHAALDPSLHWSFMRSMEAMASAPRKLASSLDPADVTPAALLAVINHYYAVLEAFDELRQAYTLARQHNEQLHAAPTAIREIADRFVTFGQRKYNASPAKLGKV